MASAIIAFGLIALGISLKSGIVKFKSMERTVAVKGLAEKQVNADKVVWRVSFARVGNDLVSLYSSLDVNAKYIKEYIKDKGIPYTQSTDLDEVIGDLDILYMTRVQRERFFNEEDYLRLKDSYILTEEKMKKASPNLRVMHPLPRVNEISTAVDSDPRACYFRQARYGKFIRMALIMDMLGVTV